MKCSYSTGKPHLRRLTPRRPSLSGVDVFDGHFSVDSRRPFAWSKWHAHAVIIIVTTSQLCAFECRDSVCVCVVRACSAHACVHVILIKSSAHRPLCAHYRIISGPAPLFARFGTIGRQRAISSVNYNLAIKISVYWCAWCVCKGRRPHDAVVQAWRFATGGGGVYIGHTTPQSIVKFEAPISRHSALAVVCAGCLRVGLTNALALSGSHNMSIRLLHAQTGHRLAACFMFAYRFVCDLSDW